MLWPLTTQRTAAGALAIGGVELAALAREYGTPLYIYDEATLRDRCRRYRAAFAAAYPATTVVYAAKAELSPARLAVLRDDDLWRDVVSGGELALALRYGFPAARITFHGNNKSPDELRLAVTHDIGRIVVDNLLELERLGALGAALGRRVPILLRLNPGVEAHTHEYRQTGVIDSKFGLPTLDDQAERAVAQALATPTLDLRGYHAHVGSQIFELAPYREAIAALYRFAAQMRDRYGFVPTELSPGGGLAIPYTEAEEAEEAALDDLARAIGDAVRQETAAHALTAPHLTVEPGRSIVGPAGVALYTVGAVKDIPGVRRYVSVDGGMADNIRPALYGAAYTAALANRDARGEPLARVTIAGKYCESGDVLIRDIALPPLAPGDLLAVPAAGAYCLAMASNYNLALRPAVVFVRGGHARLTRRRETLDDLLCTEVMEGIED
ncbi:MAG: diaminopimelate decarboxylase [Thermomicrobiales bacterium]